MSEVTRWDKAGHSYGDTWMEPTDGGDWVLWGDYEALAVERARLVIENARLQDALGKAIAIARATLKGDGHE